jgi:hypothetical protein
LRTVADIAEKRGRVLKEFLTVAACRRRDEKGVVRGK